MNKKIVTAVLSFFSKEKNVFWLGILVAIVATSLEIFRGRAENYHVFADATTYFWQGVSPYTHDFVKELGRYFLYTPVFTVLFAPIAMLPDYIGGFVWNLANYTLLFFAVMTLPEKLALPKLKIFLYLLLILEQSVFPFQYNIAVCYIFLYAFTLLEKDKPVWAVLLIMISATTKIYGVFELALLFCYKNTLRNFCYAALFGVLLLLSPALKTGIDGLLPCYEAWWSILSEHNTNEVYISLIHLPPIRPFMIQHAMEVQMGVLAVLAVVFFATWKRWGSIVFRARMMAILQGWMLLFSNASENHTYIIAFSGFMLFYYTRLRHTKLDEVLYWCNWFMFGVMPVDVLFPVPVYKFFRSDLWFDVCLFTFTWCYMIYITLTEKSPQESVTR